MEHSYLHVYTQSVLVPLLLLGMALTVWTPPGIEEKGEERGERKRVEGHREEGMRERQGRKRREKGK